MQRENRLSHQLCNFLVLMCVLLENLGGKGVSGERLEENGQVVYEI